MPKLPRVTSVLFGSTGPGTDFGQFGSKTAAAPQTQADFGSLAAFIAGCQALAAWVTGWTAAAVGAAFNPYLEDENGFAKVTSYYINQLCERGISDWDAGTTYFKGGVVQDPAGSGQQWYSLTDNNLNNAPPVGTSNAQWQWSNQPPTTVPSVGNGLKNALTLKNNTGAPTTKCDITAQVLSIQGVSALTVNLTADITVMGANGLDTGAPANNQWYAVFVIADSNNINPVASLLSISATAPTMPAGYNKFRRVGWMRRNGGGNFLNTRLAGDWTYYTDAVAITPALTFNGTNSFGPYVPSTCTVMSCEINDSGSPGNTTYKPTGEATPAYIISRSQNPGGTFVPQASIAQLPLNASQQFDLTNGNRIDLTVLGYYDPV